MIDKFSFQNLIITLIPGGFFVSVMMLTLPYASLGLTAKLPEQDFLLTFMFIALSLTVGEVIQTLAHAVEWIIDLFFKGYRPSEIFLLQNNKVVSNRQIVAMSSVCDLSTKDKEVLKDYESVSFCRRVFCGKEPFADVCQHVFRSIYMGLQDSERVKDANARYLFNRGMFMVFILVAVWCMYLGYATEVAKTWHILGGMNSVIAWLFLYRARGCARGLVRDVAFLSTKK